MIKNIFILFCIALGLSGMAQTGDATQNNSQLTKRFVDSMYRSVNFVSLGDAEKIIQKQCVLKDSTCRITASAIRYSLDYVAKYIDSTSKGRVFFSFEQYKDTIVSKGIYEGIKTENEKTMASISLNELGEEAFLVKDNLNYPFVIARKKNKIFKFKLYYLTDSIALDKLLSVAKTVISAH